MMTSSQRPLTAGQAEHRWWILAALATAQLMVALDATVVSIALPKVQAARHGVARPRVLLAQPAVHSYAVAFWAGAALLTAAALAVAPLLRPGLAEPGVVPGSDIRPRGVTTDRHTHPFVAEIAADGAPACAELKGAS